jgi:CMP/dCMP kinase
MNYCTKDLIIAIDGYSSCGKSTLAKGIAAALGYLYIDSGAMYRAVTLFCIRNKIIKNAVVDLERLNKSLNLIDIRFEYNALKQKYETWLNGENIEEEIRKPEVASNVSNISKIARVREKLVALQRKIGENKRIVMDGRDIGTVVFPMAEMKIFMTADPLIRANRRLLEMNTKGITVSIDDVLQNIKERDYIDQNRDVSPLRKADDAIVLDNSELTQDEQLAWVMQKINQL